jgi:hypothetical protein
MVLSGANKTSGGLFVNPQPPCPRPGNAGGGQRSASRIDSIPTVLRQVNAACPVFPKGVQTRAPKKFILVATAARRHRDDASAEAKYHARRG